MTSCDRTATASFGPRPISSATSSGQPTTSRSTSGKRSGVANAARPSTTTVSKPSSRASRTSERATSTPPTTTSRGPDREDLDEQRPTAQLDRPRQAAAERRRGGLDERRVELGRRRACPVSRPSSVTIELRLGRRAVARLVRAELARWRVGGEWRDDRRAVPAGPDRAARRVHDDRRRDRLDQDVDRAAAGQPDVPRLLVADPVADDPGVAGRAGPLDLLGRGALDAAAADRARDPAVGGVQQDGALGSRRGPERPDDDGPADVGGDGAAGLPAGQGVEQLLHRSGLGADRIDGLTADDTGRRGDAPGPPGSTTGQRGVGGRLAAAPRVARPDATEDLAQPLEPGDRAGRQEVVDVRVGRAHPAGQRLVAGRAGQRVEPDQPVAVAPQPGGLGRDERRVAAVPAVGHDDHDTRRPQRAPRPVLVERPERLADPRATRPVVDRVGHARERPVAVAVAQQPGDPGQPRPEHERLGPDLRRRRQGLDEPQQQPRVALHRARDVAQHDQRARLADLPPPDPRHELAAGPEVAPEHRPRREPPAVRVELVAAGPPPLEPRHEQVDQPLRLAQLGRRHPVELAVAQDLALRVGVGRDDHALDRRVVVVVVAVGRDRRAALVGLQLAAAPCPPRVASRRPPPRPRRVASSRGSVDGPKSSGRREPRRRHQRSNAAS